MTNPTKEVLIILGAGIILSALLVALVHSTDQSTKAQIDYYKEAR